MPIMIDKASGKQYRVEVVMNPLQFEGGCKIVQNAGTKYKIKSAGIDKYSPTTKYITL